MKRLHHTCSFLLLIALLALGLGVHNASARDLPSFEARTLDGKTFRFDDLIGEKVIVIDFWATYCIQCRPMLDALDELHKEYNEQGLEVVIISVDSPKNVGKIRPYFRSRGYPFTVVLDTDSQIARVLKPVPGLPYTLVVDKQGDIVYKHEGYKKGEEKLLKEKIVAAFEEASTEDQAPADESEAG
jgi:peroxiredoxin